MPKVYDAIIIGLGAMGLSIARSLAARGASVLGIEKNAFMHDKGSSHGASRIFRCAYFEGDFYTPLLKSSREMWRELEAQSDLALLRETGLLYGGPRKGALIENTQRSAYQYGIAIRNFDLQEAREAYPQVSLPDGHDLMVEPSAGILNPDLASQALRDVATRNGARLRFNTPVLQIFQEADNTYGVATPKGDERAKKIIIAAGSWCGKLFKSIGYELALRPERKTLHWFDPMGEREPFLSHRLPTNVWEFDDGSIFYGFPFLDEEQGMKYGYHSGVPDISVDPDKVDRDIQQSEVDRVKQAVEKIFNGLKFHHVKSKTCLYTMTPDEHFAMGSMPDNPDIFIAGGFSGHGYKFVPVVGDIMADLVLTGQTAFDIAAFNPARLLQESRHKE